ncbi:Protein N-acetyltransferase, RimJ/RimL family [Pseudarcicella hirudinis]|uniref:Protein N-acetyltransferase, RimJ/RimL family n=1 Tax=Pseudarcicella hirudinis TaxID=1079859 RepID=A0A1I5UDL8_9BACT|nr:GNAT family protein [Pseudarcicella hirudinis]SFP92746.1 Protein N-acetyltransferase, RimJ/RimL family [Pseudarcicella hirudinis]
MNNLSLSDSSGKYQYFLRPFRNGDEESLRFNANNQNVSRNLKDTFPFPYTPEDAEWWVKNVNGLHGNLVFAIDINGEVAGGIGVILGNDVHRVSAEIGYWLGEKYWGHGIMSSALKEMTVHTFEKFQVINRIWAGVFGYNKASMRVLEKAGYTLEAIHKQSIIKNGRIEDEYIWTKHRS